MNSKVTKMVSVFTIALIMLVVMNPITTDAKGVTDLEVIIDNKLVEFDKVKPFLKDGTTYIPIRLFSETFGYEVNWRMASGRELVTVSKGDSQLEVEVGTPKYRLNGVNRTLDNGQFIKVSQKVVIPIRPLVDLLGFKLEWVQVGNTGKVIITSRPTKPKEVSGIIVETGGQRVFNYEKVLEYVNKISDSFETSVLGGKTYITYPGMKATDVEIKIVNEKSKLNIDHTKEFSLVADEMSSDGNLVSFKLILKDREKASNTLTYTLVYPVVK